MFTKAGRQAIHMFAVWPLVDDSNTRVPMVLQAQSIKNTSNETRWISWVIGTLFNNVDPVYIDSWSGVSFGSGTTPPTLNDYKIESIFNNEQITATRTFVTRGLDTNNKPYMELTYVVTNKADTNITVSEIAVVSNNIVVCNEYSSNPSWVGQNDILIDRTLLDTPVTISSGDSASIKYKITCDMSFT